MSRSLRTNPIYFAKPTFQEIQEPMQASDYILKKKAKATYCNKSICKINNYRHLNKTDLNINLFAKTNLENVCVVQTINSQTCPTKINNNSTSSFFDSYMIDPNGQLFGNTPCGINNYVNYWR